MDKNKETNEELQEELNTYKKELDDIVRVNTERMFRILEFQDTKHPISPIQLIDIMIQAEVNKKHISRLKKDVQEIKQKVESRTKDWNEEIDKKEEHFDSQIKEQNKDITLLQEKMEDMLRADRKANFEIKNVPKKQDETKNELMEMIVCLSKIIDCPFTENDIDDVYRVRGKKEGASTTTIIVETMSTRLKNIFLKSAKSYNIKHKDKLCAKHLGLNVAEDTPLFFSEQLTAKGSRLHYLARELVKAKRIKFCWTANGIVHIKKDEDSPIIAIKNEAQLDELMQAN